MRDPINTSSDMMQVFMRDAQRKNDVVDAARRFIESMTVTSTAAALIDLRKAITALDEENR